MRTNTLWLILLASLGGCSNQAVYESIQRSERQECLEEPMPTYEQCMERTNKSYKTYKKERDELLESKP